MERDAASIKAIAIDIDGTLTDDRRRLCTNAIEALRGCEAKGCPVMVASGNIVATSVSVSKLLGLTGPVIAENGGAVHYRGRTELFGDKEVCVKAAEYLKQRLQVKELFTNQCRLTEVCLEEDVDMNKVLELLKDHPVDINRTGFAIHIMSKGTDKYNGVKRGCELLGIGPSEVLAIGDSENDIGMLRGCGIGVAVANASSDVRSAADHICKNRHGDGVVEALKHFGLI